MKDASPDFVNYGNGSNPPVKNRDSCKELLHEFFTAFPDVKGANLMAIAEGNHVAVFGDWSGTFLFIFNGKGEITEHHSVQSPANMMMQIGVGIK